MPKKQITRKMTRKRRSSHSGGAANYQKVRVKPANRRQSRAKAIGRMFKDFTNLFTRKRKVEPIAYEVSSGNPKSSSPFELVISSNSGRAASPLIIVDMPKPRSSKGSRISPRPGRNTDFTSPVPDGRGLKHDIKRSKRGVK
jgi:hypothetical protein